MTDQEPVAMRWDFDGYGYRYIDSGSGSNWQTRIKDAEPLYDRPQQCPNCASLMEQNTELDKKLAEFERTNEPIPWVTNMKIDSTNELEVPRAKWVGLTEEELLEAAQLAERGNYLVAFQRIQQKLKEKNT